MTIVSGIMLTKIDCQQEVCADGFLLDDIDAYTLVFDFVFFFPISSDSFLSIYYIKKHLRIKWEVLVAVLM